MPLKIGVLGTLLLFLEIGVGACELASLTVEQKVGQILMVHIESKKNLSHAEEVLKEVPVGGVLYYSFANDLSSKEKVIQLSASLQRLAQRHLSAPLLIAVDHEGGRVHHFGEGVTHFPAPGVLVKSDDFTDVHAVALCMGKELVEMGVNLNLAPVVDVNSNPLNPIIGERAFGADPVLVAQYGEESLQGLLEAGVVPCLKHFPGHGDVEVDSHLALPHIEKTLDELWDGELFPFAHLVGKAPAIMVAHLFLPLIDAEHCTSLSPFFLKELLRNRMGFSGVVISDSLRMKGVMEGKSSLGEVAIQAFQAGCDLLILAGKVGGESLSPEENQEEIRLVYQALLQAVQEGRIQEADLDASVHRLLALKSLIAS